MKPSLTRQHAIAIVGAACVGTVAVVCTMPMGCSASGTSAFGEGGSAAGATNPGGASNPGGSVATGGFNLGQGGGGSGAGVVVDPCASECGPTELCESPHNGLDDDCDGLVDEDCPCNSGAAQSCFRGDPSYANADGCYPGTQHCSELGTWGECVGGVHAVGTEPCYESQAGCHPISAVPFATVDLADGIGNFGDGATTESWAVACPPGVSPCPAVSGADFQPLQSGEYTVTYTRTNADGTADCTYPLFVGAPGLRVELQWEHIAGSTDSVDLDLHLHRPNSTTPWGGSSGNADDCGFNNCTVYSFIGGTGVEWFSGAAPPEPVAWSPQPFTPENTTCYYAPRGVGAEWQSHGQGCHNPRLDLDNIECTPSVTDPDDSTFCAPENINIDYPPYDEWIRVGVYYYLNWGNSNPVVHPVVKVYCDGRLAGEFGPNYASPVTWTDGDSSSSYWLVADVRFKEDPCDPSACDVAPLYGDGNQQTPYLSTASQLASSFGPPYPQ